MTSPTHPTIRYGGIYSAQLSKPSPQFIYIRAGYVALLFEAQLIMAAKIGNS